MPPNTPKSEIAAIKEEMYTHCKNKEFLITDAIIKLHSIAYSLTTTIKTAAKDADHKGLICKTLEQLNSKKRKTNNPIKKWAEDLK